MEDLPSEILYHIFTFFSLSDLVKIREVNKTLKEIYDAVVPMSIKKLGTLPSSEERLKIVLKNKTFLSFREVYKQLAKNCWWFLDRLNWFQFRLSNPSQKYTTSDHLKLFLYGWSGTTKEGKHILIDNVPQSFIFYLDKLKIKQGKPMSARLAEIKKFIKDFYIFRGLKIVRK